MQRALDDALLDLVVATGDLRRATGQALHHLWLSLARERARGFSAAVRACGPGCGSCFERAERRLRRVGEPSRDERLRRFVAAVLARLADDLEAGDARLLPFARWLEQRLPEVTRMIREDTTAPRVLDADLARDLRVCFGFLPRRAPAEVPARLREARDAVLARESRPTRSPGARGPGG